MLLNYDTVGACFFSEDWIITSEAKFAGSCIAALVIAMTLELLRKAVRNYDRIVVLQLENMQLEADKKSATADQERAATGNAATDNEKAATNNEYTASGALAGTTAASGDAADTRSAADGAAV